MVKSDLNSDFKILFWVFLRGWVGRWAVLGQAGRVCFGKQTPKKGRFFHSIACFGVDLVEQR